MTTVDDDAGRLAARAAELDRWFRRWTVVLANRVVAVLIVVGGGAVALCAHSHRAMGAAALLSVGFAGLALMLIVLRYLGIQRRLKEDPATEVARLSAKAGRHQRLLVAEPELGADPASAGELVEGPDRGGPGGPGRGAPD